VNPRDECAVVAGLGFRANATVDSLRNALMAACDASAAAPQLALTALATAQDKVDHPALVALAHALALPLVAVPLDQLTGPATSGAAASHRVPVRYGHRSLAESAALAAAGPRARLLAPRAVSEDRMATASIAITTTLSSPPHPRLP